MIPHIVIVDTGSIKAYGPFQSKAAGHTFEHQIRAGDFDIGTDPESVQDSVVLPLYNPGELEVRSAQVLVDV